MPNPNGNDNIDPNTGEPYSWESRDTPGYNDPVEAGAAQIVDPNGYADRSGDAALALSGVGGAVKDLRDGVNDRNAQYLASAARKQATNPYNSGLADRSRAAQYALFNQMQNQMNGPSLAGLQGQQALGQGGQQALMQAALNKGGGRGAMLGAQQMGAGLAGSVGQARLGEVMQAQGSMGGIANNMRNTDLVSARQQQQAGLKAQGLADQNSQFYGKLGMNMENASRQALLDEYKTYMRERQAKYQQAKQTQTDFVNAIGTIAKFFI